MQLHELGLVAKDSKIGTRVAGEFVIRYLAKSSFEARKKLNRPDSLNIVNFCFDGSRVCKQQAPCLEKLCGMPREAFRKLKLRFSASSLILGARRRPSYR